MAFHFYFRTDLHQPTKKLLRNVWQQQKNYENQFPLNRCSGHHLPLLLVEKGKTTRPTDNRTVRFGVHRVFFFSYKTTQPRHDQLKVEQGHIMPLFLVLRWSNKNNLLDLFENLFCSPWKMKQVLGRQRRQVGKLIRNRVFYLFAAARDKNFQDFTA